MKNIDIAITGFLLSLFLLSCSIDNNANEQIPESSNQNDADYPKLISMRFLREDNPNNLLDDVMCEIGDSIVECWIPFLITDKKLKPDLKAVGGVFLGESHFENKETLIDFKKPVYLDVRNGNLSKKYKILVHIYTGLPVMMINTESNQEITSKEEYINARLRLIENVITRGAGDVEEYNVQIKGRGNSTWKRFPKKPYRLKFENKVSLFGEAGDKSWVLLANYADKTMLRNCITFYLGSISNLEYSPSSHYVELFLNNIYEGTYQLSDKLKISKNRVNVGEDGFLLEIDDYAPSETDSRYFRMHYLEQPCVNIKDPDVEYDDINYTYAKQFMLKAEKTLFSEHFKNKEQGWQRYMDIDTFVDYYLINEITKNTDSMWASSFMNLKRGGKLKMGPLWDYDLAYGNYNSNVSLSNCYGFKVKHTKWFNRLFEDTVFVNKVKDRYQYFYNKRLDIATKIDEEASYLKRSVQENHNRWGVLYMEDWPNASVMGLYQNEVQLLKEWIFNRMEWLKSEYDAM